MSINILDENTFKKIRSKPQLSHSNTRVFTYGSNKSLKFQATIETDSKITTATMHVVKGKHGNLLCYDTPVELNIVSIIASVSSSNEILYNEYSDIFKGIGKLKDVKRKFHVDENGKPVIQRIDVYPFIYANK